MLHEKIHRVLRKSVCPSVPHSFPGNNFVVYGGNYKQYGSNDHHNKTICRIILAHYVISCVNYLNFTVHFCIHFPPSNCDISRRIHLFNRYPYYVQKCIVFMNDVATIDQNLKLLFWNVSVCVGIPFSKSQSLWKSLTYRPSSNNTPQKFKSTVPDQVLVIRLLHLLHNTSKKMLLMQLC